jgi:preprotein translocase subunit YajC
MPPVHFIAASGFHTLATLPGPLLAAAAKKSSGSSIGFIFIILLFAVAYMFFIRPQRQKRQRAMQVHKEISVGDKVMLSSGIFGTVEGFVGDHARIEIAPGMVIEVVRQAVSQRVEDPVEGDQPDAAPYGDHGSYDDHGHDDLVDDSGHDPYSVPPLEAGENTNPGDDPDGTGGGKR